MQETSETNEQYLERMLVKAQSENFNLKQQLSLYKEMVAEYERMELVRQEIDKKLAELRK